MQTFLPYSSFSKSLQCLDYRRLGKQRVEAMQILNVLERRKLEPEAKIAWSNHPAVRMWIGCEDALRLYYNLSLIEWVGRGYRNSMLLKIIGPAKSPLFGEAGCPDGANCNDFREALEPLQEKVFLPSFVGNEEFHLSHQSNLLRKDPEYYATLFHDVAPDLEYVWPL